MNFEQSGVGKATQEQIDALSAEGRTIIETREVTPEATAFLTKKYVENDAQWGTGDELYVIALDKSGALVEWQDDWDVLAQDLLDKVGFFPKAEKK